MKPFQFKLERLQRLRDLDELEARAAFAKAEAEVADLAECLHRLEQRAERMSAETVELRTAGALDPGAELLAERSSANHAAEIEAVRGRLDDARTEAETAREAWNLTRREQRTLERLEERQRDLWRAAAASAENATTDEGNSARHQRLASESGPDPAPPSPRRGPPT